MTVYDRSETDKPVGEWSPGEHGDMEYDADADPAAEGYYPVENETDHDQHIDHYDEDGFVPESEAGNED